MEEYNPFDALGINNIEEQKKALEKQKAEGAKIDYLIHKTFEQSDSGKELLGIWEKSLVMMPTARAGSDLIEIGINEGIKQFIRNIKITVDKVERGQQ